MSKKKSNKCNGCKYVKCVCDLLSKSAPTDNSEPFEPVIKVDVTGDNKHSVGKHLFDPVALDIHEAKSDAIRNMMDTIWCHYSNVIDLDSKRKAA